MGTGGGSVWYAWCVSVVCVRVCTCLVCECGMCEGVCDYVV